MDIILWIYQSFHDTIRISFYEYTKVSKMSYRYYFMNIPMFPRCMDIILWIYQSVQDIIWILFYDYTKVSKISYGYYFMNIPKFPRYHADIILWIYQSFQDIIWILCNEYTKVSKISYGYYFMNIPKFPRYHMDIILWIYQSFHETLVGINNLPFFYSITGWLACYTRYIYILWFTTFNFFYPDLYYFIPEYRIICSLNPNIYVFILRSSISLCRVKYSVCLYSAFLV